MKITHFGHSCFCIEVEGLKLLLDPFITPNPLTKGKVDVDAIEADYILISHGHEDHIADAEYLAKKTGAMVISNFEIITWLEGKGISNMHPMGIGGSINLPFGRLKYVTAMHSSMLPDGSYGGNPGGFVIETKEKTLYFAGDTAVTMDMQLIKREFNLSAAILPIGDVFTMGANDAIISAGFVGAKHVIGMHYDTFPYIKIEQDEAMSKFASAGLKLTLIQIGESIEI